MNNNYEINNSENEFIPVADEIEGEHICEPVIKCV